LRRAAWTVFMWARSSTPTASLIKCNAIIRA
jgi:hypothetical protein